MGYLDCLKTCDSEDGNEDNADDNDNIDNNDNVDNEGANGDDDDDGDTIYYWELLIFIRKFCFNQSVK